ncbi:uncharacterized protein CCDC197 isoform X2 [Gopherus flavomarginatus]|uniref:uncharacterized protein CCDC197 isoform X2 n=1 Tax=Gopherus flavomarginatus TaxID=286002 RepID=UPI0021CBEC55|nr:uncharacterized protein CCDC197 isoform X2 [Gopherus flavomarginatus]
MNDLESLAVPRNDHPRYSLQLENRRKNVFVTQLGEYREEEDKDVTHIPIISEAPSKILETDANSLQKTLVLKKEVEVDRVTAELIAKRQEFKERMEAVAQRRAQFAKKQQDSRNQALKFDKFLKESDVKRRRALQKYQAEVKMNEIKQREIDKLVAELEKLKVRQQKLQKKVAKQKVYEDFLLKVIDQLPDNYPKYGADSVIGAIIRRHETLSATNQTLIKNLITLSDDFEKSQHDLETLQREHDTTKLSNFPHGQALLELLWTYITVTDNGMAPFVSELWLQGMLVAYTTLVEQVQTVLPPVQPCGQGKICLRV